MSAQGWYDDPYGEAGLLRFWDGTSWTDQTSRAAAVPPAPTGPSRVPEFVDQANGLVVSAVGQAPASSGPVENHSDVAATTVRTSTGPPRNPGWGLLVAGAVLGFVGPVINSMVTFSFRQFWFLGFSTRLNFDPKLFDGYGPFFTWYLSLGGAVFAALMILVFVLSVAKSSAAPLAAITAAILSALIAMASIPSVISSFGGVAAYTLGSIIELLRFIAVGVLLGFGGVLVLRSRRPGLTGTYAGASNASASVAPVEGLTITALVLALLGLLVCLPVAIVGLVLGYVANGRIRDSRGALGGSGMATSAIVIGWCALVLWLVGVFAVVVITGAQ